MSQSMPVQSNHVMPVGQRLILLSSKLRVRRATLVIVIAATATVFLLDVVLRLGVATAVLYVPVILLSLALWDKRLTIAAAAIATVLTWAVFFISPHGSVAEWVILMNRSMSTVAIWAVAGLSATGINQTVKLNAQRLANDELTRSNSELEQFASVASHDLQAPIRKVTAFCQRLQDHEPPLDTKQAEFVSRIEVAANRMQVLVSDLLEYSRVATREREAVSVDLSVTVSEVLSDLSEEVREAEAIVEVGDLPTIKADKTQMSQLFQNLIGNALKYRSEEADCRIQISARTLDLAVQDSQETETEVVEISVKDNGVGFEQEFEEKIFEVFKRLHGPGEYEGTGIGLSICKRIAEKHHGDIRVQSSPGVGSKFTVVLPTKQPEIQISTEEAA